MNCFAGINGGTNLKHTTMNKINSQAVRNEVFNMQTKFTDAVNHRKPNKDRAVIIGFIIAMASTLAILSSLGLIPKY